MKFDPAGQAATPGAGVIARAMDQLWLIKGMRKLLFFHIRPGVSSPATGPASRSGAFREYRPRILEDNLRQIIRTARDGGAHVFVMTLPSVVSVDMTLEDLRKANVVFPYYSSAYGVGDFVELIAIYNRSIRSIAGSERVTLIDLAEELDNRPDRRALFSDTMHPSQKGRELIADILVRHVDRADLRRR
jgi:lysophospholipase L1-like esterase